MSLSGNKESNEQIVVRLAGKAGGIINMIMDYFNTPNGINIKAALVFTAALTGHACHLAVVAEGGTFAVATTTTGKRFYFGDDLNRYLLDGQMSVVSLCTAVTEVSQEDIHALITDFSQRVGDENLTVCGYEPKALYKQVSSWWKGLYHDITSRYCESPAEWPILFGIIAQNVLLSAIEAGAPKDLAGKIAIEAAIAVSKMDEDSF